MDYTFLLYILFGILPSITWLFYYLRKDINPEPKKMILKVFLWGCVITVPVFFVQVGLTYLLTRSPLNPVAISLAYWFIVIAFSEEIFKFLVVKLKVMNSPDLDEPLDIMLYMVVAALGFAAVENILYLFAPVEGMNFNTILNRTLIISFVRFLGATFLHTLCSATIGYAMAIAYCDEKNRRSEIIFGFLGATLLHGFYNFSIMTLEGGLKLAVPATVLIALAFFVFSAFTRLKKVKSVTILNNTKEQWQTN